jgi:hypothetical protein
MHRGTQHDLVAFITGLLRRSVRSVGTTVKPVTAEFGMKTSSSGLRFVLSLFFTFAKVIHIIVKCH